MKKYILFSVFILLLSSIAVSKEEHYHLIVSGKDKTVYLDKQNFGCKFSEDDMMDYYYVLIKTEFSNEAIQEILEIRDKSGLIIKGYDKLKYTIEKRIYRSDQRLCIMEKKYFTKEGLVIDTIKYSKQKWIDFSGNIFEGIIYDGIVVYDLFLNDKS